MTMGFGLGDWDTHACSRLFISSIKAISCIRLPVGLNRFASACMVPSYRLRHLSRRA
jgi:hypothetical protein